MIQVQQNGKFLLLCNFSAPKHADSFDHFVGLLQVKELMQTEGQGKKAKHGDVSTDTAGDNSIFLYLKSSMKKKDPADETDLESMDRNAKLAHCLEELDAKKKEMQDLTKKLKEMTSECSNQPITTSENDDNLQLLQNRLKESRIELDKTIDHLRLAIDKVKTEIKNLEKPATGWCM